MSNNKGRALLDGDVVRRISESNLPALPAGKAQLGFKVARPLSIRRSRSSKGSAVRRCAQGRCAAMTKPMAQVVGEAKREDDGPELLHARQLLDDGVSLERAWRELNDERSHATPQVTIESIMYCVRQRGLAALKEPANL